MLQPGVLLNDRYRLNERIAAGGMGEVWRASDNLLRRGVAVKVLLPTLMSDSEFITRFRTEARMLAALRHAGIVQVYDYGENAQVGGSRLDYLVMEYIEGVPLSKHIADAGRLGVPETMRIVAQAAEALQVAHEAGIVHRDVKPSNLLVRPGGAVVLVDFGVARSTTATGLTSTNVVLGSAHYMAPEQAEGRPISPQTDVYALGAVAYHCLAGRPPFVGDNPLHVLGQLVYSEPPPLPGDVPPPVAGLVMRALAKDPARRFPSAAAMAAAAKNPGASNTGRTVVGTPFGAGTATATRYAAPSAPHAGGTASYLGGNGSYATPSGRYPTNSASSTAYAGGTGSYAAGAASIPPQSGGPSGSAYQSGSMPVPKPTKGNRNAVMAALAVAVVIGVVGIVAAFVLNSDSSRADSGNQATTVGGAPAAVGNGNGGPGDGATGGPKPVSPRVSRTKTKAPTTAPTATTEPSDDATSPSVAATGNPYTARQLCGALFKQVDQETLVAGDGTELGKIVLMRNAAGAACVVTLKSTDLGKSTAATAYLEVQGAARDTADGSFDYYAGPIKDKADGICVEWGGAVDGVSYDSPFEHCG